VPDARVVFAADVAFVGSTPVMWAGPLDGWLRALDAIEALEPDVVVPGHGPVTDLAGLATLRAYWTYIDAAARQREGRKPEAVAREIGTSDDYSAQPFGDWDCPERGHQRPHARPPPQRWQGASRAGSRRDPRRRRPARCGASGQGARRAPSTDVIRP
jgi:glyoxylase-like metal-dependent hydrolase (beta-lactamase superfamily II)